MAYYFGDVPVGDISAKIYLNADGNIAQEGETAKKTKTFTIRNFGVDKNTTSQDDTWGKADSIFQEFFKLIGGRYDEGELEITTTQNTIQYE